ncbi:DNase I-like protein [Trametes polyzona]|nr:DNase I-like protein [Trametes polyzona]
MKENKIGILLLQETHLTEQRIADIHRMYAGNIKIFHSAHPQTPTQKEGVTIVLNKKLVSTEGTKVREVVPGRALQLSMPCRGGDTRHILCVYAPTSEGVQERCAFFKQVETYYEEHPRVPKPHVMAGDFNNTEDFLDRMPMSDTYDSSVLSLDSLKMSLGLMMVDGWRRTHPQERDFTFHRGSGENARMSRLDRIYVTQEVYDFARGWKILQPSVRTDHLLVTVQLTTLNAPEAGPGRPTFPLGLLKHKSLAKKMKERGIEAERELRDLQETERRTNESNPQLILSKLKRDWLKMARDYERATVPKLLKEIQDLEAHLKEVKNDTVRDEKTLQRWQRWRESTMSRSRETTQRI